MPNEKLSYFPIASHVDYPIPSVSLSCHGGDSRRKYVNFSPSSSTPVPLPFLARVDTAFDLNVFYNIIIWLSIISQIGSQVHA